MGADGFSQRRLKYDQIRLWHKADIPLHSADVRFRGNSRHRLKHPKYECSSTIRRKGGACLLMLWSPSVMADTPESVGA